MKKLFADFKKFITRGNVVDMAVGVAVAGAFTKIVNAFTNGFISPLLALLSKDANLAEFKWVLREAKMKIEDGVEVVDIPEVAILWGSFIQTIIDFLIIALALFIVMRTFNHVVAKAKEASADLKEELKPDRIKEAEAALAKAEAEKKAAEEAAAAAAAQAEAEKKAAALARSENTEKLLTEIRDLLKEGK